jgi:hypothetical protein
VSFASRIDRRLCEGVGCDKKETCWRFRAQPDPLFGGGYFVPRDPRYCQKFVPMPLYWKRRKHFLTGLQRHDMLAAERMRMRRAVLKAAKREGEA